MLKEVNEITIQEFTKLLITMGDYYEVLPDNTIRAKLTGDIISVAPGKKPVPIVIFYSNAPIGDYAYLNPYKETMGKNVERDWFFTSLNVVIANIVKSLMVKLVRDCVDKVDNNYDQFPLMSKIADKADATMVDEIDKLRAMSFIRIYYDKKEKTCIAQTELFLEELKNSYPKYRKKTWEVIKILFDEFFDSVDDFEDTYKYQATILSIPETDAKLHVIIGLVNAIGPLYRDITGKDLHEKELEQHLEVLEGYAKLYSWAAVSNDKVVMPQSTALPWQTQSSGGFVPITTATAPMTYGYMPPQPQQYDYGASQYYQPITQTNPNMYNQRVPITYIP